MTTMTTKPIPPDDDGQLDLFSAKVIAFPGTRRAAEIDEQKRAARINAMAKRLNHYSAERAKFFLSREGQKVYGRILNKGGTVDEANDAADQLEEAVWTRLPQLRRQGYADEGA